MKTTVSEHIRQQIAGGGERLWRHTDFRGLPSGAVAQTLSRLARSGKLRRVAKGIYFRPRQTPFGESKPNPKALQELGKSKYRLFPAGVIAANQLGLTTQQPMKREMATTASNVAPTKYGRDVTIHTRRPSAWNRLTDTEAALLDTLRNRAKHSELSANETIQLILSFLKKDQCLEHLLAVADTEPPRVRALLGALAEELKTDVSLDDLKNSLNPLSRFDFGLLGELKHANRWQAKERPTHETFSAP